MFVCEELGVGHIAYVARIMDIIVKREHALCRESLSLSLHTSPLRPGKESPLLAHSLSLSTPLLKFKVLQHLTAQQQVVSSATVECWLRRSDGTWPTEPGQSITGFKPQEPEVIGIWRNSAPRRGCAPRQTPTTRPSSGSRASRTAYMAWGHSPGSGARHAPSHTVR